MASLQSRIVQLRDETSLALDMSITSGRTQDASTNNLRSGGDVIGLVEYLLCFLFIIQQ